MSLPNQFSINRYLTAKKSVDSRALNQHVWKTLQEKLSRGTRNKPTRILEIGAGVGTMVERIAEYQLVDHAVYSAIDADPTCVEEMQKRLDHGNDQIKLETETAILQDFVERERGRRSWDLLVANAVLDLLDLASTLPLLQSLIEPGGLMYFTINFDGVTILEPSIEPSFDSLVEKLYNRTMDERIVGGQKSGDSHCGRHLFKALLDIDTEILAAGSSDWVVFAGPSGYSDDEQYFLHHIIHTIEAALFGHPELDEQQLTKWVKTRHAQIEDQSLVYIAHQLDFLCQVKNCNR